MSLGNRSQVTPRERVGIVDFMLPTLRQIAGAFVRYANATFGGGSATTAVLHRAIVDERTWVAPERFALIYALARLTPGTNLLALRTGLGWQLRGWRGALIALLAASVPCSLIVVVVRYFFEQWSHNRSAETRDMGSANVVERPRPVSGHGMRRSRERRPVRDLERDVRQSRYALETEQMAGAARDVIERLNWLSGKW
jgi:hypothetical protein